MKKKTDEAQALLSDVDRRLFIGLPVPPEEALQLFGELDERFARSCGALDESGTWDEAAYDEDEAFEAILFELEQAWNLTEESMDLKVAQALNEYMRAKDEQE